MKKLGKEYLEKFIKTLQLSIIWAGVKATFCIICTVSLLSGCVTFPYAMLPDGRNAYKVAKEHNETTDIQRAKLNPVLREIAKSDNSPSFYSEVNP